MTDCDDINCMTDPTMKVHCAKTETGLECSDGRDNNQNHKVDCDERSCQQTDYCKKKEYGSKCFDGKDNDNDGRNHHRPSVASLRYA